MSYLKTLRAKVLEEGTSAGTGPANATTAGGGGGPSASSTSAGGGSQGASSRPPPPPPKYSQSGTKPPPPQPGRSEQAPPGTGPSPKTSPPKKPPPETPSYKSAPPPPPQRVIEPENMPSDKGVSMNANVRWMENLTIYGSAYGGHKGQLSCAECTKSDRRPLLQRVADEFERVCDDFRANEEVGQVFPTPAEMHVLTRMKGIGYQTEMKELTGSRDPKFFQMFLNVRCTSSDMSSKPLIVISDSSM
eukprot:2506231-Amphidinium_carterae.2